MMKKVFVFCGDMTMRTGDFHSCLKYADNFDLPIVFVVEDNGLSTDTKTEEVWNDNNEKYFNYLKDGLKHKDKLKYYRYTRTRPHYGVGEFVTFPDDNKKDSGRSF